MQSWIRARAGLALIVCMATASLLGDRAGPHRAAAQMTVGLEPLGYHDLGGHGMNADLWLHRGIAYVGTEEEDRYGERGCSGVGVKIVSLADPAQPMQLGTLADHPGTTAEQMRVRAVETPTFSGDLLATGLQRCGPGGLLGLELWDVTDPRAPQHLSYFEVQTAEMDPTGGVHELDLIQRSDGRVLALLAVPFSEHNHPEGVGDFRIVDVTDPRAPRQLAAWGAGANLQLGQDGGQGLDPSVYAHSVRASPDGRRAYVSYWDAGVLIFDLNDPTAPQLLGRTTFDPAEEGNAHSVDLKGDRVLVQADEVYEIEYRSVRVDGPPELAGMLRAGGTLPGPPWPDAPTVSAELALAGRGCPAGDWTAELGPTARLDVADPYPQDPSGKIALLDRGLCTFATKLERAKAAGAVGAVIVNTGEGTLSPQGPGGPLGAFLIAGSDGQRLTAALQAGQTVQVALAGDLRTYQDFGGLSFWDIGDPRRPRMIGTFQTPRTRVDRATGPAGSGLFTVHNPVVRGDLLVASWYADGVRVLDISDPTAPRELAVWVPPARETPGALISEFGPSPVLWGVAVEGDLVAASDINAGLYILRLTR